jgi:hypothetical protein
VKLVPHPSCFWLNFVNLIDCNFLKTISSPFAMDIFADKIWNL